MNKKQKDVKSEIKEILNSFVEREISYAQAIEKIIDVVNDSSNIVSANVRVNNFISVASFDNSDVVRMGKKPGLVVLFDEKSELEKMKGISVGQSIVISVEKDRLFYDSHDSNTKTPEDAPFTWD